MRWEGEGYRTQRLEGLLEQDTPAAVDEVIAAFAVDVPDDLEVDGVSRGDHVLAAVPRASVVVPALALEREGVAGE